MRGHCAHTHVSQAPTIPHLWHTHCICIHYANAKGRVGGNGVGESVGVLVTPYKFLNISSIPANQRIYYVLIPCVLTNVTIAP